MGAAERLLSFWHLGGSKNDKVKCRFWKEPVFLQELFFHDSGHRVAEPGGEILR